MRNLRSQFRQFPWLFPSHGLSVNSGWPQFGSGMVRAAPVCGFCSSSVSTSDFQSEVGEVFGEVGGELPAKFGRRFSSFLCWENRQQHFPPKLHRKFHHQTSLRGSGLWRALPLESLLFFVVSGFFFPDLFHASFFSFLPPLLATLFLPFSRHLFALLSPSKSALFCRAKRTAQSLERGSSGMDLSTHKAREGNSFPKSA